jgi:uncharacterized protein YaiE (UPF0345 family)
MEFHNVSVDKNSNTYFEGRVTSRNIKFSDGSLKTLGVMLEGEYEFNTSKKEIMEITTGEMHVLLPNSSDWKTYIENTSFEVPANSFLELRYVKLLTIVVLI